MLSESSASSLAHVELLAAKQSRLRTAQLDAEAAFLASLVRDHLNDDQLFAVYERFKVPALPGFTHRWEQAFGTPASSFISRAAQRRLNAPNGPGGLCWVGGVPVEAPAPTRGQSVVYVLFDDQVHPCYVGSSQHFRSRLRNHIRDGKPVVTWTAYPCSDREAAYALEDRLLREYKPYLNVRAGR